MMNGLHVLGVRHHSPACARLVEDTLDRVRPTRVLIEGPADFNDRLDELALGHKGPIAIYSYASAEGLTRRSWTPFCDYSPEWVALAGARRIGARAQFIDLPAWHHAFAEVENRYSDAERRYSEASERLCREFNVDNSDALWDHLIEIADPSGLAERLERYFELVRGESEPTGADDERERYMAQWIRSALAESDGPVAVVCGGFHAPALRRLAAAGPRHRPETPAAPEGADAGSFLVPYTFRRLDAFAGYQSGMPSPEYYQRLWDDGPDQAAAALVELTTKRLRERGQIVSTADLIGARSLTEGLSRLRGHQRPSRTDLLDGLASALIGDDLERPLPWTKRGTLAPGTHPVVVEMTAALTGDRMGRLHPDTPAPPLVADVRRTTERLGLDRTGTIGLDLTAEGDLECSRTLHRLRLLSIPGIRRDAGPAAGTDVTAAERWELRDDHDRLPAVIEAGVFGATLGDAAQTVLERRVAAAGSSLDALAVALFDGALCGRAGLTDRLGSAVESGIGACGDLAAVGRTLEVALALWRHDHLFGTAGSDLHANVVSACADRTLWLAEGLHAGPEPAQVGRLRAMAALRDAVRHAPALTPGAETVTATARRIGADPLAPPDLRGAASGLAWTFGAAAEPPGGPPSDPGGLGDWLAGLFAVAREEVLADPRLIGTVGGLVGEMSGEEFLNALPALRQAFGFFPPRELAEIAERVSAASGESRSARSLLSGHQVDPVVIAASHALESKVDAVLEAEGLTSTAEERT